MKRDCSNKSKYYGNSAYICNPSTGRYVKRNGSIGKHIVPNKGGNKSCSSKSIYHNNSAYICNPNTGRYVKRSGPIGKLIKRKSIKKMSPRIQAQIKGKPKLAKSYKRYKQLPLNVQRLLRKPPRALKPLPKYNKLSPRLSKQIKNPHKLSSINDKYDDLVTKINNAYNDYSAEQNPVIRKRKQIKYNRYVSRLNKLN